MALVTPHTDALLREHDTTNPKDRALFEAVVALRAIEQGHRTPAAHARANLDTVERLLTSQYVPNPPVWHGPSDLRPRGHVQGRVLHTPAGSGLSVKTLGAPDAVNVPVRAVEGEPCPQCRSTDTEGPEGNVACRACGHVDEADDTG